MTPVTKSGIRSDAKRRRRCRADGFGKAQGSRKSPQDPAVASQSDSRRRKRFLAAEDFLEVHEELVRILGV